MRVIVLLFFLIGCSNSEITNNESDSLSLELMLSEVKLKEAKDEYFLSIKKMNESNKKIEKANEKFKSLSAINSFEPIDKIVARNLKGRSIEDIEASVKVLNSLANQMEKENEALLELIEKKKASSINKRLLK